MGLKEYLYVFARAPQTEAKIYKKFLDWVFAEKAVKPSQRYYAKKVLTKMIKAKLVFLTKEGRLSLTEEGRKKLVDFEFNDFTIPKPAVWDGKFRVIIFDITVERNRIRTAVRRQLISWGFVRLQNSVWVHAYECQEVVGLLKAHFGVVKDVIYMTVDSLENDQWLKKELNLN